MLKISLGAVEMSQCLRAPVILTEDVDLVPSKCMLVHNHVQPQFKDI